MHPIEKIFDYQFKDRNLLKTALTHKSYSYENGLDQNNERLEFLGDAVIDLYVGEILFHTFINDNEGDLSKKRAEAVRESSLAKMAKKLNLQEFIQMGKGEVKNSGHLNPRILSSCFEALVGALYIDAGTEVTKKIINKLFQDYIDHTLRGGSFDHDYKSLLQEKTQKNLKLAPQYELVKEEGPSHDKIFFVKVLLNKNILATAHGKSKKEAEQRAAHKALIEHYHFKEIQDV